MTEAYLHTFAQMGTVVTIHVVGHGADDRERREREDAVARAADWFQQTEAACSRFDQQSELSQLSARAGQVIPVSALLFEAIQFALAVAEETAGAFDPTVGQRMEARGFNCEYRTGQRVRSVVDKGGASFRDVQIDPIEKTVTLLHPLLLDLGAVAKGLAIDLAARELQPYQNFAIDAGGDLYFSGCNAAGKPWSVGIRHPREPGQLIDTISISNSAVCTSGDYERPGSDDGDHHIIDPRTAASASALASVTVLAPSAMVADALATAAFVLGPADGMALLERHGVDALLVTPALERIATPGFRDRTTGRIFSSSV